MSKPDDIPQDVWNAAGALIDLVADYVESFDGWNRPATVIAAARAIMAERERCASVADTYFMRWENDGSAYWLERRMHSEGIAGAISSVRPDQTGDEK